MEPENILDLFRLDDKTAIVTGGSKGLGKAIARAFAQAGADSVIVSRKEQEVRVAAEEAAAGTDRTILPVAADVQSDADVARIVETTLDRFGKVDILVNAAGINNRKEITELSVAEFQELIDINLTGSFRMCKAVAPHFLAQESGKVVNLSSILDHVTIPGRTGYSSSKGGVLMLTKTLALEWAAKGICVNALSPGPFATPMNKPLLDNPELNREFIEKIPVKRWGEPYEVGAAAVYLASPASNFVTGTTLYIDGAWTAH